MRRLLAVLPALLLVALFGIAGAPAVVVAGTEQPNRIVDYETIFGSIEADGTLKNVRLVDQLRVFGQGAVTVTDPMSTEDFRNLLGEGDADVQDDAVVWNISELSGMQEFITASTPDVDPPLGMVVTYFRDGERVEPQDLIGKSGSIDITFDVSNLTAEPMEISYEDGGGNTLTAIEQVPIPMVAELSLELPKGTFTEVEAPLADIVTQPDGDLTVRWSMVLVPPIGETSQSFNLNAMTDGFELGPIRLAGVPVAPKDRPFLAFAQEEFADGTEAAGGLYSGSSELAGNIDDLHDGTLDLLDGMQQLLDGSKELSAGLVEAADGSGQLTDGSGEARAGSAKLTEGLGDAFDGSEQITGGLGELRTGLRQLLRGLKKLAAGLPDAAAGANQMAAALKLLDVGLASVKACLTGGGLPCSGNPSISAILGALQAGVGPCLTANSPTACGGNPTIPFITSSLSAGAGACLTANSPTACGGNPTIPFLVDAIKATCDEGAYAPCGIVDATADGVSGVASGVKSSIDTSAAGIDSVAGGVKTSIDNAMGGVQLILTGLAASIGDPSDAPTASIRGGIEAVRQGALLLVAGIGDAITGLGDELTENTLVGGMSSAFSGAKQLAAGSAKLTAGLDEAHAGSGELTAGLVKIEDGSGQLTDGLNEAADGSAQITDGLGQAKAGAGQIEQGVYLINEVGVREISRSASQTAAEIDRKLALMEAQDERAAAESLLYGPPSSDQAEVVVGGSGVVLTMDALNRRGDDSVARGVGAGVGFAVLGGLTLVFLGLRRRVT